MKKTVCLLLTAIMILTSFSLPIYALDVNSEISDNENGVDAVEWEHSIRYTCIYDADSKRVKVSGTLDSAVFADYSDWTLCVYAIPAGRTEEDIMSDPNAKPLAEAMVSIKFEFAFKADETVDRYSLYAIFLKSPQNELILTTEAQYPEVASSFEYADDRRYYKGLQKDFSSFSTEIEAGTAILPVQINSLFSDTSTSLFVFVDQKQYFFNENAIEALDIAIRSMSVSGTKIYLRFLYEANIAGANGSSRYALPDLYNSDMLIKIHSVVTFLAERYSNDTAGEISGIILGKGWDDPNAYNYVGNTSLEEYADKCVIYTTVVANAARSIVPSMDIVVPLTVDGFVKNSEKEGDKNYFKQFVEALLDGFDVSFYAGIKCSFLLDCDETPLGITNQGSGTASGISLENPDGLFYAGAHREFSAYLSSLEYDYRSTPDKYMFVWTPEKDLRGDALATAYAYSYYALLSDSTVYSFVINFSEKRGNENTRDIAHIMKYIDTHEGETVTNNLPKAFGKNSWDEIFASSDVTDTGTKHCYGVEARTDVTESFAGEFMYFDFSASSIVDNWYRGAECTSVKIDYTDSMDKALRADFNIDGIYSEGELLYIAEYSENMIYTPTLRFKLHVDGDDETSLYEVRIIVGNSENHLEASCIVNSGELTDVYVDISRYIASNMVDYIRLSARCVDGSDGTCSLWLYNVAGLSRAHDSEELAMLVSNERDKIRHLGEEEEERQYWGQIALALGVILIIGALGAGLFISFKRENASDGDKGHNDQE